MAVLIIALLGLGMMMFMLQIDVIAEFEIATVIMVMGGFGISLLVQVLEART